MGPLETPAHQEGRGSGQRQVRRRGRRRYEVRGVPSSYGESGGKGAVTGGNSVEENRLAWVTYLLHKKGKNRKEIRYERRKLNVKKKKKIRGVLWTF
jgi:hypothetical protein